MYCSAVLYVQRAPQSAQQTCCYCKRRRAVDPSVRPVVVKTAFRGRPGGPAYYMQRCVVLRYILTQSILQLYASSGLIGPPTKRVLTPKRRTQVDPQLQAAAPRLAHGSSSGARCWVVHGTGRSGYSSSPESALPWCGLPSLHPR